MRRRWAAVGLVAVLVAGSGAAYGVASGESTPRYRTVAATTGDVEQTLASSGTVDAANRADLGFGTDGTIAALKVAVGDVVKAGQILAVLETTDLDAAVTDAKASVAQAVAQLAADREAQSAAVEEAVSEPDPSSEEPVANDDETAKTLRELTRLQDAVLKAQQKASAALAAAKSALAAQTEVCAEAYLKAAAEGEADSPADPDSDSQAAACTTALAVVQERQQQVSDAQDELAKVLQDLAGALTQALGSASGSTPTQQSAARTDTPADTSEDSAGPQSGGTTITAARLAADQAQIEQARAELVTAQQARAQAKLVSTRSGRVADLAAGVGEPVSAGDTIATVIGGKAVTIQGTVAEEKVDQVKVGQTVRVTVPGSSKAAEGTVTAIGLVADSSSGTTSYPVTVTVEDPTIPLPTGSSALLEIVLSTAKDVVTVPTSAVSTQGDRTVVEVWDGTKLSTEQVTLGVVGARRVQVTDGVEVGDHVVLAAIDDPIDGASSELNERGGFGPNAPMIEFRNAGPGGTGGGPKTFSSGP